MIGLLIGVLRGLTAPAPAKDPSQIQAADCWDAMGLGTLVPRYLILHLAGRNPSHQLLRQADGSIKTDDAPGMFFFAEGDCPNEAKARASFLRMINERLPNKPDVLSRLAPVEIVGRLCAIYDAVTKNTSYGLVCRNWCVQMKLI